MFDLKQKHQENNVFTQPINKRLLKSRKRREKIENLMFIAIKSINRDNQEERRREENQIMK
jgi:hypothetical protein